MKCTKDKIVLKSENYDDEEVKEDEKLKLNT